MTDLDLRPASPWRRNIAYAAVLIFALTLGWSALDSGQREREAVSRAATFEAAYGRVCDAAGATQGGCVATTRDLADFRSNAAALGAGDAAALEAMLSQARAEGRAEALSQRLPAATEPRHDPSHRPARLQRLDRRVCDASGVCAPAG